MRAFLPSWKGTVALGLAILAALFLPALLPAGRLHRIDPGTLVFAFVLVASSMAPALIALREQRTADKIAGALAIGLALVIAYVFYNYATS